MPSPYSIEQTAQASGLSIKFIRRLKSALPEYFEKHTERGVSNALFFDEEILEVLKRTRDLKNKGRTLQQIRDELASIAVRHQHDHAEEVKKEEGSDEEVRNEKSEVRSQQSEIGSQRSEVIEVHDDKSDDGRRGEVQASLRRENELLRSQVSFLQDLLRRAESRFDRLLPEATTGGKKQGLKSQVLLWLVEASVVTVFATGFIFMIWLFAQKAFTL